ncbi:2-oxo acid dehydrogenase subunit E2 [Polynucleobacter sp. UK-Gri1-W3]|uniref:2-oxo acid dehydrogenase subunit E2 n=1 Tax=Polynucleobacter sp. UK-Gri1-W3 TaxID=1819737 RepID=UPI001C0CA803|nr:2-oxo acid dehydrogenase subunit E2 [Polynucleobacter sp. UK-Gri1-W3]MBU3538244.1 2-oxo acid dehydrogenase subunit E2 [Polynucleobacter sp. UK-Gri1-W3]
MIEILVPRENVNDESVIILEVNFASGSKVKKGDVIVSIETSKTNIDIDAPEDGVVAHKLEKGDEVDVGSLLFTLASGQDFEVEIRGQSNAHSIESNLGNQKLKAKFSIAAIKRAKELGVNLSQFDHGWLTSIDVEKHAGVSIPIAIYQYAATDKKPEIKDAPVLASTSTKVTLSKRKQAEAKNLIAGDHGSTTSTIGIEIKLLGERLVVPPFLFKDSISDLIAFEASKLLRQYPELNGSYIDEKTWAQYGQVNFGWSFDNGKNLKVLAIKNADTLSLGDLQGEVGRLLDLYDSGTTIPMDLLNESTVTFSDLSRSPASFMYPLINGHQTLILGVVRKSKYTFEIFASFDHRVSEGLSVVNFLTELKSRVLSYFFDKNGVVKLSCYACGKSMVEELGLGHRGFIKMTLANGEDENLCRNCFEGW